MNQNDSPSNMLSTILPTAIVENPKMLVFFTKALAFIIDKLNKIISHLKVIMISVVVGIVLFLGFSFTENGNEVVKSLIGKSSSEVSSPKKSDDEMARVRAEADAVRIRAEADALRIRTEADAVRTRTEADSLRLRTESAQAQVDAAAQAADAAAAAQAQADAAAVAQAQADAAAVAQAQADAAAHKKAEATIESGAYFIRLGAFRDQNNADKIAAPLIADGHKVIVLPANGLYSVRVVGFTSKNDAIFAQNKMKKRYKQNAAVQGSQVN